MQVGGILELQLPEMLQLQLLDSDVGPCLQVGGSGGGMLELPLLEIPKSLPEMPKSLSSIRDKMLEMLSTAFESDFDSEVDSDFDSEVDRK